VDDLQLNEATHFSCPETENEVKKGLTCGIALVEGRFGGEIVGENKRFSPYKSTVCQKLLNGRDEVV
jgi:hypothetical protein